ncbi:hypothetical protein Zmor_000576 [Zophobas morio]|uniref:Uncharacterized protein n=1 Tax=Zophobas morio TaxID=2755281 RepID=A0AA38MRF1_9CUCU|nr:hypothetical protein Zmor_000576 [Zophobas morio]
MKDKKTRLVEKSARVDESRGQKHRRDLKLAAKQVPVENVFKTYLSKDAKISIRLTAKRNTKPRRKSNEKSGTPNGSTGLLGFSVEQRRHWKRKNNSKRHRIIHNQKYDLLLEALERK